MLDKQLYLAKHLTIVLAVADADARAGFLNVLPDQVANQMAKEIDGVETDAATVAEVMSSVTHVIYDTLDGWTSEKGDQGYDLLDEEKVAAELALFNTIGERSTPH